ncbi:hypothetical protein GOX2651 (plasmid) [Gluconobacter oxydans 621H]|uniref:Uncharacterized protein n=1 Tax=Gluconobacter oxydans (strain 621H) TaxID=290633 RepID=Q5HXN8_GLUOX|nr:hypothetical protein GOX2651 [Gluconobacter oxydans 621H]
MPMPRLISQATSRAALNNSVPHVRVISSGRERRVELVANIVEADRQPPGRGAVCGNLSRGAGNFFRSVTHGCGDLSQTAFRPALGKFRFGGAEFVLGGQSHGVEIHHDTTAVCRCHAVLRRIKGSQRRVCLTRNRSDELDGQALVVPPQTRPFMRGIVAAGDCRSASAKQSQSRQDGGERQNLRFAKNFHGSLFP